MADLAQDALSSSNPIESMFSAASDVAATNIDYTPDSSSRSLASNFVSSIAGSGNDSVESEPSLSGKDTSSILSKGLSTFGSAIDGIDNFFSDMTDVSGDESEAEMG